MPLDFALAGKSYEPVTIVVRPEEIEAYARAVNDDGPRYRASAEDQIAPPVFPVAPAFPLMGTVTGDPELGVDNPLMILHGEQEFAYYRPLRPNEPVTYTPVLERVDDKGPNGVYVVRVDAVGPEGDPIVEQWWTIFVRGGGSGGEKVPSERTGGPERTDEVARFEQAIDLDMPKRYAEASGDHNPIHLDESVAKMVGLPGVINHGLGTLALVSGGLVRHLAGGDATRLQRLQTRFTAPVFPGESITTTVWQTEVDGLFSYETTRPDGTVAAGGEVEVA